MKTSIKTRLLGALCAITLLAAVFSGAALTGAAEEAALLKFGDVNQDGTVNTTDARLALQFSVSKIDLDLLEQTYADVNGDLEVNTTDARMILQRSVGKLDQFPVDVISNADLVATVEYVESFVSEYKDVFTAESLGNLQAVMDEAMALSASEQTTNEQRVDVVIRLNIALVNLEIAEEYL